jgi:hypothetical protein
MFKISPSASVDIKCIKIIDRFNDLKMFKNKILSSINSCCESIKSQDKKCLLLILNLTYYLIKLLQ